ncbi:hypothetical protein [Emticicia sp. 17c]|uniref:hypothetical protein n=1 Tax=Emticicia sp. 17c TaxID=3127704 RepID=UPI00301CFC90
MQGNYGKLLKLLLPVIIIENFELTSYKTTSEVMHLYTDKGATLALVNSNPWPPSSTGLKGTNDWTQLSLNFNSGTTGIITISSHLGYTNTDSSGTAYFDNLTIVPQ